MAKKEVDIFLNAKDRASKAIKDVGIAMIGINQALEVAGKLADTFEKAYDFAKIGANVEKTEFAFNRMSKSVGADADRVLAEIRNLTGGTISDFDLMQKAAKATTLGIPIDRVGEFAEVARAAAAAMGESTAFMFDSIVTGTARQSRLILDNLGIIISESEVYEKETKRLGHELSDVEKKQAFMNAVLESGQKIVSDIGDTSGLTSEKFDRFEASISNLRDALATILSGPVASFLTSLANMASRLINVTKGIDDLTAAIQAGDIKLDEWNETFVESVRLMDAFLAKMDSSKSKTNELAESLLSEEEIQALVNKGLADFAASLGIVTTDLSSARNALNSYQDTQLDLKKTADDIKSAQDEDMIKSVELYLSLTEEYSEARLELLTDTADAEKNLIEDTTSFFEDEYEANLRFLEKVLGMELRAWITATNEQVAIAAGSFQIIMRTHQELCDDIVEQMWGAKSNFRDIFEGMAKDFVKMFIEEVTKRIAIAIAKWAGMLIFFDNPVNDLRVVQMGRDYARLFQQGVFEGMDLGRMAGSMARTNLPALGGAMQIGPAMPAGSVTVIIQGNVIGEDEYVKEHLIPAIEGAVSRKESNLAVI